MYFKKAHNLTNKVNLRLFYKDQLWGAGWEMKNAGQIQSVETSCTARRVFLLHFSTF